MHSNPGITGQAHQLPAMPAQQATGQTPASAIRAQSASNSASSEQSMRAPRLKRGREDTENRSPDEPPAKRMRLKEAPAYTAARAGSGPSSAAGLAEVSGDAVTQDDSSGVMDTDPVEDLPPGGAVETHEIDTLTEEEREFLICKAAAERGDTAAQRRLARMVEEGVGVEANAAQARALYERYKNAGNAQAQQSLVLAFRQSLEGEAALSRNLAMRRALAAPNQQQMPHELAELEALELECKRERKRLIDQIKVAAEQGSPEMQWLLALSYRCGDVDQAITDEVPALYRKAAQAGYVRAHRDLAQLYSNGWIVERDLREALHSCCRAARCVGESVQARSVAGQAPASNATDESDLPQDLAWCHEAAKHGQAEAQDCLSFACEEGTGVEKNQELAFHWALQAARQGHDRAQYRLGNFYS